ncbi:RNA polymerase sigma factor [Streptomyces kanamyceticus]|uniref:Putative RNA polymerase sigma factor n=1 Tax=Streptomyces kanamyceticus TaxID=1967 RepID=Q1EQQ7_STRKN|nr:sigma-70 family RNA polymerase sigma factor [Streptomyces kanamyceticus]BAE95463.1 putative RNA polymerase sigma factor [Streptomyces kanamyceticus]
MNRTPPDYRIPPHYKVEIADLYCEAAGELEAFASHLMLYDRVLAPDFVQDAFQAAAHQWQRLRALDRGAQRAWLFRVLKNKVFDHWGTRAARELPLPEVPAPQGLSDPPRQALSHMLLLRCWHVMDQMPPVQRKVALLRWRGEWTSREIAEHLGICTSTVRVHLGRARQELWEELGSEMIFPSEWWDAAVEDVEWEVSR